MRIRRLGILLLCAVLLGIAPTSFYQSAQAEVKLPKLNIQTAELANGLKIVMLEDHRLPLVGIQVWYHVGSKDERPGRTGFAHLFEHLMFKGTKNTPSEALDRMTEDVGGMNNAFTNDDVTVYLEVVPANHLRRLLWAEADRMGALSITEPNFLSERDVVKEERRQSVENAPYGLSEETMNAAAFTRHPYQHTTIGSMTDLNRATLADVNEFHDTFYAPNNATLVIVGDFDAAKTLPIIKEYFEPLQRSKQPIPRVTLVEPPQTAERKLSYTDPIASLPAVQFVYHIPEKGHPDSYALRILGNILSRGESSRLYQELVYKQQVAVEVSAFGNFTEHPNLFSAFGVAAPGKSLAEVEKAILAEIEKVRTKGVLEPELNKAKAQVLASTILGRQSLLGRAQALGEAATFFGDPNRAQTDVEKYGAVTGEDVKRVAEKYFTANNRTVMQILVKEGGQSDAK
ncbi:MAG: insulinase family protein [Blastocatellia bacterium]|nr:insulinase family protein [Blastocatellia bacterium]